MLLDAKADANTRSNYVGVTALMAAAQYDHLDVVHALIEARADLNVLSSDGGGVALYFACQKTDNHRIVTALIVAGALLEAPGASLSLLSAAIRSNSFESFKLLLAAGADVNGSAYSTTPLSMATLCDNVPAAKLLLDAKADVKSARGFEFSLLRAVSGGSVEFTKLFISAGADVNMRSHDNFTCLHVLMSQCLPDGTWTRKLPMDENEQCPNISDMFNATPCDYPGVFQVLIDAKADVTARISVGNMPLHIAANKNNVEAVTALLAAGAGPDDIASKGLSAIHSAAYLGFLGVATALIAAGADVNRVEDGDGASPLFLAADGNDRNHLGVVSALIAAGADVNCVSNIGYTPLMLAAARGNLKIVSALIAARANVNYFSPNPDHKYADSTPLDIALCTDNDTLASILKASGAVTWESVLSNTNPLFTIIKSNSNGDETFEFNHHLIDSVSDTDKDNAFKVGILKRVLPIVQSMLAAGVNPSLCFRRRNLLCWASIMGYTDIVEELIDAGADITFKGPDGMTALQHAAKERHRDVVALLLTRVKKKKYMMHA
jgi:ankyrin repeat protein